MGSAIVAAGFIAAATISASADLFVPWIVLPLGLILAVGGLLLMPRERVVARADVIGSAVALLFAIAWTLSQCFFPTEFLRPSRDPGIYTLTGIWLAQHGTPSIDVSRAVQLADGRSILDAALGFPYEADLSIHLQGGDAAPSIVAYGWWAAGLDGALRANVVMGGVALLAVYELGRRVLRGPLLALVPAALLGASMPMIYFARAPYTETAAVALFAAAASVLVIAFRKASARGFVLAGALAGVASMTRIDTALGLAAMMATFLLVGLGVADMPPRLPLMRAFLLFACTGALFAGLATVDLLVNYARYVSDLGSQVALLWALLIVTCVVTFAVLLSRHRHLAAGRNWIGAWSPRLRRGVAAAATAAVAAIMVFWVTRPFWLVYHQMSTASYRAHIEALQRAAGVAIDPSRSYDEYSVWWFAWYFGWPMVGLLTIGLMLLFRRAVLGRDAGLLAFLALTCAVALLYINLISIAADQMWAFRRVLPVITPGFLIAAVAVAGALYRVRRHRILARLAAVLSVVMLLVGVRVAWTLPLYDDVEFAGQRAETERICDLVKGRDLVVVSDVSNGLGLTVRVVCGIDVLTLDEASTTKRQASLASLAGEGLDVAVVTEQPDRVAWSREEPAASVVEPITRWDNRLFGPPELSGTTVRSTWVGVVGPDGALDRAR